ncbi:hypothetical protein [Streptomyces flavofungini]|uniref:hypothetical protein n=1 Tax=Streptomyces flavofungini TaxID=68200 RepID=UPI0025AFF6B9|nr:hypothetical protein [Streptomyces flavofungini]WJV44167.1 hypothetical protein QUY26_00575 [Streptomyces flavofungini]
METLALAPAEESARDTSWETRERTSQDASPAPAKGPLNGLATLALAYGTLSVIGALIPPVRTVTGTIPVPALVLGVTGWANAHRMDGAGRKQALAGLATGLTGLVLTLCTL